MAKTYPWTTLTKSNTERCFIVFNEDSLTMHFVLCQGISFLLDNAVTRAHTREYTSEHTSAHKGCLPPEGNLCAPV